MKIAKENEITVIIKKPGEEPYVNHFFYNTLEGFQKAVGGYIEAIKLAADAVIIVNEEGLRLKLPANKTKTVTMLGTMVVCGRKRDEFCSLKPNAIKLLLEGLKNA